MNFDFSDFSEALDSAAEDVCRHAAYAAASLTTSSARPASFIFR